MSPGSIASLIGSAVFVVLLLFFFLMWVRFVVDLMRVLRPRWRPRGAALVIAEGGYAVTDPPIRLVRRVVRPVQLGGGVRLELSWSIVMLACLVLMWVASALI